MKTIKFVPMLILALSATVAMACNNKKETVAISSNNKKAIEEKVSETGDKTALFKKGTLIEVAFLSVKVGKEKQLNEQYFAKVMPIAMEYGMKPLMTVGVKNAYSEKTKPQMVGFFEWPSIDKKEAFEKDVRFLKLKPIRTDALSFLQIGFFKVDKDTTIKLDGSLFYEIYAMDLIKEKASLMGKYFEKAAPLCIKDYGVDFALSMTPVCVSGFDCATDSVYTAETFGIAIWPNEAANTKYFGSKEYAEIKHYKEEAIKKMDAWQGAVMLQ